MQRPKKWLLPPKSATCDWNVFTEKIILDILLTCSGKNRLFGVYRFSQAKMAFWGVFGQSHWHWKSISSMKKNGHFTEMHCLFLTFVWFSCFYAAATMTYSTSTQVGWHWKHDFGKYELDILLRCIGQKWPFHHFQFSSSGGNTVICKLSVMYGMLPEHAVHVV